MWRDPPRAGSGSALLLLVMGLVLVTIWPDRPEAANMSWYPLTVVRATGLAAWAWLLGAMNEGHPATAPSGLFRLLLGALVTAPIEAFAFVVSVPTASLTWSLSAPLLLAWAFYGVAWLLASGMRRLAWPSLLTPVTIVAGVALVVLDQRLGLGWWTPWIVPRTPSWPSGVLITVSAIAAWGFAWRGLRPSSSEVAS